MTIAWMLYAIIVGGLIALAARAGEALARMAGRSVRWIWAVAIAATLVVVGSAPYRRAPLAPRPLPITAIPSSTVSAAVSGDLTWSRVSAIVVHGIERAVASVQTGIAHAQERVPSTVGRYVAIGWAVLAVAMLVLLSAVHARFRRARRRWPTADLCGVRVRLSPEAGPAVLGFWHPEIVVPHWLLARSVDEQRLALAHEVEHVRARDPLLLGVACAATALVPWNPAAWWMLSRLRLAVELDCDARVLRGGAVPYTYGSLLIAVAEHCSGLRLSVPALADDSSHLHQRLLAMKPRTVRFAFARRITIGAVGMLALVVACEAKLPTATDIADMDAASAHRAAKKLALVGDKDTAVVYMIDGKVVTADAANTVRPEDIASIEVLKSKLAAVETTLIKFKLLTDHLEALSADGKDGGRVRIKLAEHAKAEADEKRVPLIQGLRKVGTPPLLIIDGKRAAIGNLDALNRDDIESVEVVKGPAALRAFGADAADGVIVIKTKRF